ncbi:MAG: hypothetical protein U1A78_01990 [Polyangia bacterium]
MYVPGHKVRYRGARLTCWLWLCAALLGLVHSAAAQPKERVLVLGILQEGAPRVSAREAAVQRLRSLLGDEAVRRDELSNDELLCQSKECLTEIGRRHEADKVIAGTVTMFARTFTVKLTLLDTRTGDQKERQDSCNDCSSISIEPSVEKVIGSLFNQIGEPGGPAPATPSATPSATSDSAQAQAGQAGPSPDLSSSTTIGATPGATPGAAGDASKAAQDASGAAGTTGTAAASGASGTTTPAPPTKRACPPPIYYTFGRGAVLGLASSLTAVGLISTVTLAALDGQPFSGAAQRYTTARAAGLAFGTTLVPAGALVGSVLTHFGRRAIDNKREAEEGTMCVPVQTQWTFRRGIAVGSSAGVLLSGIVAAVGFGAVHGRPFNQQQSYDTLAHAVAIGAPLTVAGTLSLVLSIAIP